MQLQILDTGCASAEENMRLDQELLSDLSPEGDPILHLYEWHQGSATYGHFADPSLLLDLEGIEKEGIKLAKRPTGGGVIFHDWDFAFSLLVPSKNRFFSLNSLENYGFVNGIVSLTVKNFLEEEIDLNLIKEDKTPYDTLCARFCMATPTKYDVVSQDKKIAGAAQRKCKQGFLHQGSIALLLPPETVLTAVLKKNSLVREAMEAYTFPLLEKKKSDIHSARKKLKNLLIHYVTNAFSQT